jgi:phage/conjugal plasmid C-4 type zinc finger TraR family protein
MSGYGGADDESVNAMAMVDNAIELSRMMLPTGPSSQYCLDCGEPIPQARREAQVGCKYCITCQPLHDKAPKVKVLDRIL